MTISLSIEILKKNKLQIKIGSTERKLTSVNLYQSLDMSRPTVWYGSVVGATGTQINISDGINTQIYNGNFYYGSFGLSGGTINSTYYYYGGALIYSITSGSVDALTAFNFMNSGNALGLLGYVLSGSDSINGSFYNDTILGFSGNDLIYGNGGNDIIVGGGG